MKALGTLLVLAGLFCAGAQAQDRARMVRSRRSRIDGQPGQHALLAVDF